MSRSTLDTVTTELARCWTGLDTATVHRARDLMRTLTRAPAGEPWLAQILEAQPESVELYRDPEHGFLLLAHVEQRGSYRSPHDHGSGWVVYAVQSGVTRMGSYRAFDGPDHAPRLVSRGARDLLAGDCEVYLPGDIHDTECRSDTLVQFRLTSCDFALEKAQGRMTVFPEPRERASIPAG